MNPMAGKGGAQRTGGADAPTRPPVALPIGTELDATARALLEAFVAISSDLDTHSVLQRIVDSACQLSSARYGALGVLAGDGALADLVTHGVDTRVLKRVGLLLADETLLDMALMGSDVVRIDELTDVAPPITFPNGRVLHTLLMAPIRVRGTPFGQLYLSEKPNGGTFSQHDELLVKSLAGVAGFVIANARAYGTSERRRRWLEKYSELSELLMPPIDLTTALGRIAGALLEVSGARSTSIVVVPEGGAPYAVATCGEPPTQTEEDLEDFARSVREAVSAGQVVDRAMRDDSVAVIAPLRAHLTVPGVLVLTHPRRSRPEALEERELLASFANQAALALDRTQALQDRQEMAVLSDRDRIARDLHDVVIQRLFATGLQLQTLRAAAGTDDLRERIDDSVSDLDQTIRDIRATIFELQSRPRNSLRTDVSEVVQEFVPKLGFAPSVLTTGAVDSPIDPQLHQHLISALREALTNVVRHAQATGGAVELQVTSTHLRLRVTDDGVGLPEEVTELGLRNIRRRAMLLGGDLDLWPNDPSGTILVWSVPLPA